MDKQKVWKLLIQPAILSSCSFSSFEASRHRVPTVQIDHIIVGTSDLDAGMREFEQLTGVRPTVGGVHAGQGTRNALVSLGDGVYLELYAPNPAERVASSAVSELLKLPPLKPIGWAASTTDVDSLRYYYGQRGLPISSPEPGSRVRLDGSVVRWVTAGLESFDNPLAPFFIRWEQQHLHPSRTSPPGCSLASITLRDQAPELLRSAVRPLRLNVRVARGREKELQVRLSCPRGTIVLR